MSQHAQPKTSAGGTAAKSVGGEAFGQSESLTRRLKGLLREYREGVGIIKELIQNADDAGARVVCITLDWRTHKPASLPIPQMKQLMGPAILVYNDAVFTDNDFKHIQTISQSAKSTDLWKTGRFGIGFNAVYHVTDWPSFISRDRICFFDPHRSAVQFDSHGSAGRSWRFDAEGWWQEYPELMQAYEAGGLTRGAHDFPGTLFRLPLRTREQATRSEIRQEPFEESNVRELLQEIVQCGEELLIFLKSVEEIKVREIPRDCGGSPRELLRVVTCNPQEVRRARTRFRSALEVETDAFLDRCRTNPETLPSVSYLHLIETRSAASARRSTWRVVGVMRVDTAGQVLAALQQLVAHGEKAVPWAGAAARINISTTSDTADSEAQNKPINGRAYCFLPLPVETGLPIHVNGFFDLDGSRHNLTSDSTLTGKDRVRATWNQVLVRHVLSHACANLVSDLAKDLGGDRPEEFYALWPVRDTQVKALRGLAVHVARLLYSREVIRATAPDQWVTPKQVQLLPDGWDELAEPLTADGVPFPQPGLPIHIIDAFTNAQYPLSVLRPSALRNRLIQKQPLRVRLDQTPRPCLRKREWVVQLLDYCLSDNCLDLKGLPLAIVADGTLRTFDCSPSAPIYLASREAMKLFPSHHEWFLDPAFVREVPKLRQVSQGVTHMSPTEVAKQLISLLGTEPKRHWEPEGTTLPNAQWLADVYDYFALQVQLPQEELRKLPIVPGLDGRLHQPGLTGGPFLCPRILEAETRQALKQIGIVFVPRLEPVLTAIRACDERHPNIIVRRVEAEDAIDALAASSDTQVSVLPLSLYASLMDFLTSWAAGPGKQDRDRQDKLRRLRILLTSNREFVASTDGNVHLPDGYEPPSIAGEVKLLFDRFGGPWRALADLLGVRRLDRAALIQNILLPRYTALDRAEQRIALAWIRDNLENAQTDVEKHGKNAGVLRDRVGAEKLVRCADGQMRAANCVYDPESLVVREVLGGYAPLPDMEYYAEGSERWLPFFRSLGLITSPAAKDLAAHVERLMQKARESGPESVADSCLAVFNHVAQHWNKLKDATIEHPHPTKLPTVLRSLAWLPAVRGDQALQRYPGYRVPRAQLYRADEMILINRAHLVASQRPLFRVPPGIQREILQTLGFPLQPKPNDVIAHLDHLIDLWQRADRPNIDQDDFERSLNEIYRYFHDTFVSGSAAPGSEAPSQSAATDGHYVREHFARRQCLWHDGRFWQPEHAFQVAVPFFGHRRACIVPGSRIARSAYEFLGQKREPQWDDYVAFIRELADEYGGRRLPDDEADHVLTVLALLEHERKRDPSRPRRLDVPLLTDGLELAAPGQILIPDAPWRVRFVDRTRMKLLHARVPHALAAATSCHSLLLAVSEKPRGEVEVSGNVSATALCEQWQRVLRSPQFQQGLKRIVYAEHECTLNGDMPSFKWTEVRPARQIMTDLFLRGHAIPINTSAVSGDFYFDRERKSIYLRDDDRRTMLNYLATVVSNELGEFALRNLSPLEIIFDEEPERIENKLTKIRIRHLQEEAAFPNMPHLFTEPPPPMEGDEVSWQEDDDGSWDPGEPMSPGGSEPPELPTLRQSSASDMASPNLGAERPAHTNAKPGDLQADARTAEKLTTKLPESGQPGSNQRTQRTGDPVPDGKLDRDSRQSPQSSDRWLAIQRGAGTTPRKESQPKLEFEPDAGPAAPLMRETTPAETSVPLPESHTPYGRSPFQPTPMISIDRDALRRKLPEAQFHVSGNGSGASHRSRRAPGYTGPLEPVNSGTASILARSFEDGSLWLGNPKPAALFPPEEANRTAEGDHSFPAYLMSADTGPEGLCLYVDYQLELLHFRHGNDRERMKEFLFENGLHPGCELSVSRMENGGYRIGYIAQETRVDRVPIIGLDPVGLPTVSWAEQGITVPCPVNKRLLLAQQRFVDDDAKAALQKMSETAPDILHALIGLLESRTDPVSLDDLYLLNFHVRPVSFGYFEQVVHMNSGEKGIFVLENGRVRYVRRDAPTVVLPRMGGRNTGPDPDALRGELEKALRQAQVSDIDRLVEKLIAIVRRWAGRG